MRITKFQTVNPWCPQF